MRNSEYVVENFKEKQIERTEKIKTRRSKASHIKITDNRERKC